MKIKKGTFLLLFLYVVVSTLHSTDLSPLWMWDWYRENFNYLVIHCPKVFFPIWFTNIFAMIAVVIFLSKIKEENIV